MKSHSSAEAGDEKRPLMAQDPDADARVTPFLSLVVLTAASAGFLFGYDLGISGGVLFLMGAIVDGAAQNLTMLIIGRTILGVLDLASLTKQFHYIYLKCLQRSISSWGWRLSLGLGALPAAVVTTGFIFLPESPSNLIERGHLDQGLHALRKVRGVDDVEEEFEELIEAIDVSKRIKRPWRTILKRNYCPQLAMAFAIPFFQQVTGVNIIAFYAPIMFQTFGFATNTSLYSVIALGVITIAANIVTVITLTRLEGANCSF